MDNDLDLKFLAIGDSGVGKTCLLNQYVGGNFNEKLAPTVGIDIRDKNILYKSNKTKQSFNVHLQLWDTAGQERFRSLTSSFFRDAMGFLLVFDLTNETSFKMFAIGLSDLEDERIITKAAALEFASQNNVDYIETSALNNINVGESVELLLDSVMDRLEQNQTFTRSNHRNNANDCISKELLENHTTKKSSTSYCCNY